MAYSFLLELLLVTGKGGWNVLVWISDDFGML